MIFDYQLAPINTGREKVLEYLKEQHAKYPDYKVLDIGGSCNCWAKEYVTHIIDFIDCPPGLEDKSYTKLDFESLDGINVLDRYNKYFDFIICTHTLEDMLNPTVLVSLMGNMGVEGFIAVPSKYSELSKHESCYGLGGYLGYHHHHWIWDMVDGVLTAYPKMPFLEHINFVIPTEKQGTEINFRWRNTIPCRKVITDKMLMHKEYLKLI